MTIADLNQEIRDLCDADTTSYTAATLLRRVNNALEMLVGKIINADGHWQYDDTNYTDLPVGTGNLVSGQSSYSFSSEYLDILEVMILTTGDIYQRITPFDPSEMNQSWDEWVGSATGTIPNGFPQYYDKVGDSIRFDRSPTATHATLTSGLKVRFKRTADLFTSAQVTTGTKVPGIASPYHQLIAYMAAIPYCMSYKKDRVALYEKKVDEMTKDMIDFYTRREKDDRPVMTTEFEHYE